MSPENRNKYSGPPLLNIETIKSPSAPVNCTKADGNIKIELAKIGGITPDILIFKGKNEESDIPEAFIIAPFGY